MQSSIKIIVSNSFIVTYKLKVCGQPITKIKCVLSHCWAVEFHVEPEQQPL